MSDKGDYREPKAGDWVLVVHYHDGVVSCQRVERIDDGHGAMIAYLADGSAWAVETGAPLNRRWSGHHLWPADISSLVHEIGPRLDEAHDIDTNARILAVLLDAEQAKRQGSPE
jgi:hypothetical protein